MNDKLTELLAKLMVANAELKQATEAERSASSDSTAARNKVNDLQKAIDKELDQLRAKADWNTDWQQHRGRTPVGT